MNQSSKVTPAGANRDLHTVRLHMIHTALLLHSFPVVVILQGVSRNFCLTYDLRHLYTA